MTKVASSVRFKKQESPSDPNRDPDGNWSRQEATEPMEQIANHFEPKGAERTGYPVLSAPDVSSHAGGHWFESSSLHQKVPDFARNQELFFAFAIEIFV